MVPQHHAEEARLKHLNSQCCGGDEGDAGEDAPAGGSILRSHIETRPGGKEAASQESVARMTREARLSSAQLRWSRSQLPIVSFWPPVAETPSGVVGSSTNPWAWKDWPRKAAPGGSTRGGATAKPYALVAEAR